MEVWDIAKAFDMSVKEFCALCGYSRQSLCSGGARRPERRAVTFKRINEYSKRKLEADKADAERKFRERAKAIEEFEKKIIEGATKK